MLSQGLLGLSQGSAAVGTVDCCALLLDSGVLLLGLSECCYWKEERQTTGERKGNTDHSVVLALTKPNGDAEEVLPPEPKFLPFSILKYVNTNQSIKVDMLSLFLKPRKHGFRSDHPMIPNVTNDLNHKMESSVRTQKDHIRLYQDCYRIV